MHSVYIFDFDGTLVDSMPYWSEKVLSILKRNNISYPADIIKHIATLGDTGTAKYFRDELGVKLTVEEMFEQMDAFALPKYRDEIGFKEGVKEYLTMLKGERCSLNVLTASPHKMLDPCLKRLGVFDIFDNVWSCDDFSMTKNEPTIYTEAVKRIGCDVLEAVFFDDNINALRNARNAGLFTVGVYDDSAKDSWEDLKQIADIHIRTFLDFKRV